MLQFAPLSFGSLTVRGVNKRALVRPKTGHRGQWFPTALVWYVHAYALLVCCSARMLLLAAVGCQLRPEVTTVSYLELAVTL